MAEWCILRTRGRSTLRLAEALSRDGVEAWTPRETRKVRIPRLNVRRDVTLPLMPSFVFAKARHLVDLLDMKETAEIPFSVMHYADRIPLIADAQLTALRRIEARRAPRKKAERSLPTGVEVKVKIEGGSFAGMTGKVESSDQGFTLVAFSERMTVKIATSLLTTDSVGTAEPSVGYAVRKAA